MLEVPIDMKDSVKIGLFSSAGSSKQHERDVDHDLGNKFFTPFGILSLINDNLELILKKSKVSADFMVNAIETHWQQDCMKNPEFDTLVLYSNNGSENSSHHTQYMKRLIEFFVTYQIKIILAYYPPCHSKYNPVELARRVLEKHWNGKST